MAKNTNIYFHLLKLFIMCFILFFSSFSQTQPVIAPQEDQQGEAAVPIVLTVLRGNPDKGGGELQQYQIKNGETVFVKVIQTDEREDKVDVPYENNMKRVSTEIVNKISDIDVKKKEYSEEIYPAFRAPIDLDKQAMEAELQNLRTERDRLESEQRAKQAELKVQSTVVPPPKPRVASGYNIQPMIEHGVVSFDLKPRGLKSGATESNVQAPAGKWVKVLSKEDGGGSELWIKGELAK